MTSPIFRVFLFVVAIALFCILTMLSFSRSAYPADSVLTWTLPTEREPDPQGIVDPLPPEEIAGFQIYHATNIAGPYTAISFASGPVTTSRDTNVSRGLHCYVLKTVDTDGLESVTSSEACKNVRYPPKAATSVNIKVEFTPPGQQ